MTVYNLHIHICIHICLTYIYIYIYIYTHTHIHILHRLFAAGEIRQTLLMMLEEFSFGFQFSSPASSRRLGTNYTAAFLFRAPALLTFPIGFSLSLYIYIYIYIYLYLSLSLYIYIYICV